MFVHLAPDLLRPPVTQVISYEAGRAIPYLAVAFINIHHYVVDGAIWKLRDPAVRDDLMLHLKKRR